MAVRSGKLYYCNTDRNLPVSLFSCRFVLHKLAMSMILWQTTLTLEEDGLITTTLYGVLVPFGNTDVLQNFDMAYGMWTEWIVECTRPAT